MSPQLQEQLAQKMAEIQAMMAQAGMAPGNGAAAMPGPAAAPMMMGQPMGGWVNPMAAPGGMPAPIGWSVAIEVEVQGPQGPGKATVDLAFSAETWQQAPQIVQGLVMQGYRVKVYVPKPQGGFGGGGFGGNGGYGRNGGGWSGGGGYDGNGYRGGYGRGWR